MSGSSIAEGQWRFCQGCYSALAEGSDQCPRCDGGPAVGRPTGAGLQGLSDSVSDAIGLERIEGFSGTSFFADLSRRRTPAEVEAHFIWGFPGHIPAPDTLVADWPRPWAFLRVLGAGALLFAIFAVSWRLFANTNLIAGLIMTGSFAAPVAMVVFFYEMNIPRNISIYHLIRLFLLGGVASMFLALLLSALIPLSSAIGPPAAGVIEEAAKLVMVVAALRMMRLGRHPYLLNGILIGATIGAGFAAFESAGYALRVLLGDLQGTTVMDVIVLRGVLSPFSHIAWTAIAAAALWRASDSAVFNAETLRDPRFLRLFAVPVVLHAVWDIDLHIPAIATYGVLAGVAVIAVLSLLQTGVREIGGMSSAGELLAASGRAPVRQ